jgi:hypothetical protein
VEKTETGKIKKDILKNMQNEKRRTERDNNKINTAEII